MDLSEARQLRHLEDENAWLKKLLAQQMLNEAAILELCPIGVGLVGAALKMFRTLPHPCYGISHPAGRLMQ